MCKKLMCLVLALVLVLGSSALAINYSGSQENEATFETLGETRISSPAAVANLETNTTKVFVSHPVLDGYPEDTTFVYRSPNLFGGRAAARLNTNILVFAEQAFADKDAAFAYLKDMGLIDIIDEAIGSVVLVTPSNGNAFGAADQKYYYALQTAMLAQKAGGTAADGTRVSYSDAEYFGGYGYLYVIGIDGGATFINNYVASTFDYASRIAGLLLINGGMDRIREVATFIPTILVNAPKAVIEKYKGANDTTAYRTTGAKTIYFNQTLPLQQVITIEDDAIDLAAHVKDAYYSTFINVMRVPVLKQGLFTASTPYQGYNFDEAPYSLYYRNTVINGVTNDGLYLIRHDEERFAGVQTANGQYLQTWFEYLPEEVLNNTAPAGTVPLILANHGSGDDPRVFVDEIGLLEIAGRERIAVVAAEHQNISDIRPVILPALVEYMLDTYPALDRSRTYVLGYSMGGGATFSTFYGNGKLFAAAAPMAAAGRVPTDEQRAQYDEIDIPMFLMTSEYDIAGAFDQVNNTISANFQTAINIVLGFNEMPLIEYDFAKYPINGFAADQYAFTVRNNEFGNHTWFIENEAGVPMIGLNVTEGLVHALYPEYGELAWEYLKHFSRNQDTLEIVYNPYVD